MEGFTRVQKKQLDLGREGETNGINVYVGHGYALGIVKIIP